MLVLINSSAYAYSSIKDKEYIYIVRTISLSASASKRKLDFISFYPSVLAKMKKLSSRGATFTVPSNKVLVLRRRSFYIRNVSPFTRPEAFHEIELPPEPKGFRSSDINEPDFSTTVEHDRFTTLRLSTCSTTFRP